MEGPRRMLATWRARASGRATESTGGDAPIAEHESAVRRMLADAGRGSYEPLRSLDEAKARPGGVVVMEGDYGGSIYLTCPARIVNCDDATLRRLLLDLDKRDWNDADGVGLYYEVASPGSGIAGGTGGATVTTGVWLHPDLEAKGLRERVEAVIAGRRTRLD
jgi:hypothetical protein